MVSVLARIAYGTGANFNSRFLADFVMLAATVILPEAVHRQY